MATILDFGHAHLQRRIKQECKDHETRLLEKAKYCMPWEPEPCETEDDWNAFLNGDYEL